MKDIYRHRQPSNHFLIAFLMAVILIQWLGGISLYNRLQKAVIPQVYQMVWQMDSSCYEQIKNNSDGVIRMKLK
jgi:hypothetical protein